MTRWGAFRAMRGAEIQCGGFWDRVKAYFVLLLFGVYAEELGGSSWWELVAVTDVQKTLTGYTGTFFTVATGILHWRVAIVEGVEILDSDAEDFGAGDFEDA